VSAVRAGPACLVLALASASASARALDQPPRALATAPNASAASTPAASAPAANAPAASASESTWSTRGALTLPRGRWELAVFASSHLGLADGIELAVQPFLFFGLPHAGLKLRVHESGPWTFALAPRISYPSPFLSLVAREGAGGLLPDTTDVPFALALELDALASYRIAADHLASARLGFAVAPHAHSDELPLLDFPFLYPRFAALYTPIVPRLALAAEGPITAGLHYGLGLTAYLLPLDDVHGYALEPAAELDYRFGAHVALTAGLRTSIARYPVGTRFHYLPHLDVKVGF
jgi:hypothetical protein